MVLPFLQILLLHSWLTFWRYLCFSGCTCLFLTFLVDQSSRSDSRITEFFWLQPIILWLPPSVFVSQPTIDFVCQQQQICEQLKKLINPLFDSIDKSTLNNFDLTILKDICTIIYSPSLMGPLIPLQSINTWRRKRENGESHQQNTNWDNHCSQHSVQHHSALVSSQTLNWKISIHCWLELDNESRHQDILFHNGSKKGTNWLEYQHIICLSILTGWGTLFFNQTLFIHI